MKDNFRIGLCQMKVVDDKKLNLDKAKEMIDRAAKEGAEMIILPEMFNCPYDTNKFKAYAESRGNSKSLKVVSNAAKNHGVYLIAGSIPELLDGKFTIHVSYSTRRVKFSMFTGRCIFLMLIFQI